MFVRKLSLVSFSFVLATTATSQDLLREFEGIEPGAKLGFAVGDVGDVNGDGRDDFIVGEPLSSANGAASGRAAVLSGASFLVIHLIEGFPGDRLGYGVAGAGDVDGNGVPDFILGSPTAGNGRATVRSGMDGSIIHVVTAPSGGGMFGAFVDGAGDIDGDGKDEFVVSAPVEGAVRVYRGSNGTLLRAITGLEGHAFNGMRLEAHDGGDMNDDGIPDLIVGEAFYDSARGRTSVYSGADGKVLHEWIGDKELSALYGYSVDGPGDVNDDGVPDVLIGISHKIVGNFAAGEVQIRDGATGDLVLSMYGPNQSGTLGRAVSAAGDVNGDGVGDWIAGAPYYDDGVGETVLVSGASGRILYKFFGDAKDPGMPLFGYSISGAGDLNGDGFADLLLSSPGEDADAGNLRIFAGNDLFLIPNKDVLSVGDTLTLTIAGGTPGMLAAVFLTHVDGSPDVQIMSAGFLDANGEHVFSIEAPPSASGSTFTFQAAALKPSGFADSISKDIEVK